ncbi:MAG: cation:proton antiporter [Polyangiaceae bacterium]|nr:cation:proton antiporter [Polyangiaceae bacterium]
MSISDTILVLAALLTLALFVAGLTKKLPIPFTVFLVVLGLGLRQGAVVVPQLKVFASFSLTPELVFFVFLPALVFESALNLDAKQLLKDVAPIMALAVPALLLSTGVVGLGVWWALDMPLSGALLFGALISATDPVAVVALFKELGVPIRLMTLVEGESLFNDATAIVLFHLLLAFALGGESTASIGVASAAGEFVRVFIGGIFVGTTLGFGLSELTRRVTTQPVAIVVMSIVLAYASFTVAEHALHVSGVMATVAAGITFGLFSLTRMAPEVIHFLREVWEVQAFICNALLFLMVGLSVNLQDLADAIVPIIVCSSLVITARALSVYSLVPVATRMFRLPKVDWGERHIMWWGGLKGGLAVAIVLSIPNELEGKQFYVTITLGVVLMTLLVNAPTIRPLIRFLGIDQLTEHERHELQGGWRLVQGAATQSFRKFESNGVLSTEGCVSFRRSLETAFEAQTTESSLQTTPSWAFLEALRVEQEELDELYHQGFLEELSYLDMRADLVRQRELWQLGKNGLMRSRKDLVSRLELRLLSFFRESNLMAPLITRYQRFRLSHRLQRALAGILTAEATIRFLNSVDYRDELRRPVLQEYQERVRRRRSTAKAIENSFETFYVEFQKRFFQRSALIHARNQLQASLMHGEIGAKAFAVIDGDIDQALGAVKELPLAVSSWTATELIERVPLFANLPPDAMLRLVRASHQVVYLEGDVVIQSGERGNALYLVLQGLVAVFKKQLALDEKIAELGAGDFFGESALLSNEPRSATVQAVTATTLLRLTRKDVLRVAESFPDFKEELEGAWERRSCTEFVNEE